MTESTSNTTIKIVQRLTLNIKDELLMNVNNNKVTFQSF